MRRKRGKNKTRRRMERAIRREHDRKLRLDFHKGRATPSGMLGPKKPIPWLSGEEAGRITY